MTVAMNSAWLSREGGGDAAEEGTVHKRGGEVQYPGGQDLLGQEVVSDERQRR